MPEPRLTGDRLSPAWAALTDEQKLCWKIWAINHPVILTSGDLWILYPWQCFYSVNAWLAVADASYILPDPPTSTARPEPKSWTAQLWAAKHKTATGTTERRARLYAIAPAGRSADELTIVTQGYTANHGGPPLACSPTPSPWRTAPRPRHCIVVEPEYSGPIDLTEQTGYFTTGDPPADKTTIVGPGVARRKKLRAAQLIHVSLLSGLYSRASIDNPTPA